MNIWTVASIAMIIAGTVGRDIIRKRMLKKTLEDPKFFNSMLKGYTPKKKDEIVENK